MKLQGIDCLFTREEWLQTLEKTFDTQSIEHQGHDYIYINSQGHCESFSSQSEAIQQEYKWKLTVDDIILVSREHFNNYLSCQPSEVSTLRNVFEIMDKGAQKSWWSMLIHWWRGLGFKDTHTLVEEQLQVMMAQQIQQQYQQLLVKLEKDRQTLNQLNDERFTQSYAALFDNAKKWVQVFEQNPPKTYQEWKKYEDEVMNIVLEVQQMYNFSKRVLDVLDQTDKLVKLNTLYPDAPIENEKIDEIDSSLNQLVDQMFDKFSIHDEEVYKEKFDELDKALDKLLSQVVEDYEQQTDYQANRVDEIFNSQRLIPALSPLKGISSLRSRKNNEDLSDIFEETE